jgi:hypothetical protein
MAFDTARIGTIIGPAKGHTSRSCIKDSNRTTY